MRACVGREERERERAGATPQCGSELAPPLSHNTLTSARAEDTERWGPRIPHPAPRPLFAHSATRPTVCMMVMVMVMHGVADLLWRARIATRACARPRALHASTPMPVFFLGHRAIWRAGRVCPHAGAHRRPAPASALEHARLPARRARQALVCLPAGPASCRRALPGPWSWDRRQPPHAGEAAPHSPRRAAPLPCSPPLSLSLLALSSQRSALLLPDPTPLIAGLALGTAPGDTRRVAASACVVTLTTEREQEVLHTLRPPCAPRSRSASSPWPASRGRLRCVLISLFTWREIPSLGRMRSPFRGRARRGSSAAEREAGFDGRREGSKPGKPARARQP